MLIIGCLRLLLHSFPCGCSFALPLMHNLCCTLFAIWAATEQKVNTQKSIQPIHHKRLVQASPLPPCLLSNMHSSLEFLWIIALCARSRTRHHCKNLVLHCCIIYTQAQCLQALLPYKSSLSFCVCLVSKAAAQSAMEARDKLEENLAQAHKSVAALREQHEQVVAELERATSTAATSLPADLARIQELSDQVILLTLLTTHVVRALSVSCGHALLFKAC